MRRISSIQINLRLMIFCIISCGLLLSACEGEKVVFPPNSVEPPNSAGDDNEPEEPAESGKDNDGGAGVMAGEMAGVMGGIVMAGVMVDPPPSGMEVGGGEVQTMIVCTDEPDVDAFAASVGPRLVTACGGGICHAYGNNQVPRFAASVEDFTSPPLTTDQANDLITSLLPNYIIFGESGMSEIYTYGLASAGHYSQNNYSDELASWIDDAHKCETIIVGGPVDPDPDPVPDPDPPGPVGGTELVGGMDVPPMEPPPNPTEVFCSALPSGDPQGRYNFYETFRDRINGILTYSCGASGCHGQPYPNYSFWVLPANDPCSVQANFVMSQLYIDFNTPLNSPLLTYPIDPEHGGGGKVFPNGNSDQNYNEIRNWIVLGQNP